MVVSIYRLNLWSRSVSTAMIYDLCQIRAPPVLMLLLVLLQFNTKVKRSPSIDFCEVWAGEAEVTKALRRCNMVGSAFDILHDPVYDITSVTGFLCLASSLGVIL